MSGDSYKNIYQEINAEINSPEFDSVFRKFQCRHKAFRQVASSAQMLTFLHDAGNNDYALKDELLYAPIAEIQSKGTLSRPAWTLLLAAMWPGLSLALQRVYSLVKIYPDPFSEIYWAFIQVVEKWPKEKKNKIAANLLLNTAKLVKKQMNIEQVYMDLTVNLDENMVPGPAAKGHLKEEFYRLAERKIITPEDAIMLTGYLIYNREIKELAAERRVSYKTAYKRYVRAVNKLKRLSGDEKNELF